MVRKTRAEWGGISFRGLGWVSSYVEGGREVGNGRKSLRWLDLSSCYWHTRFVWLRNWFMLHVSHISPYILFSLGGLRSNQYSGLSTFILLALSIFQMCDERNMCSRLGPNRGSDFMYRIPFVIDILNSLSCGVTL